MRQIEKAMCAAIKAGKDFKSGNTVVTVHKRTDGAIVTTVYLFNNMIAQCGPQGWGFKLCGWDTVTTRSRINAIMADILAGSCCVNRVRRQLVFSRALQHWAIDSVNWIDPKLRVPQLGAISINL